MPLSLSVSRTRPSPCSPARLWSTNETLTVSADKRPYIVYLQGGPGFGSPKTGSIGGWIAELAKTHRVILLDQRGTGMSSPLSARNITAVGDAQVQAEYTELFRADSIIADAGGCPRGAAS